MSAPTIPGIMFSVRTPDGAEHSLPMVTCVPPVGSFVEFEKKQYVIRDATWILDFAPPKGTGKRVKYIAILAALS